MEEQPKKKKPYSKPQIFFEDFRISTHIAADCDTQVQSFSGYYNCGFVNSMGQNVFTEVFVSACRDIGTRNENYDDPIAGHVCWYNSGGDAFTIHSS